MARILSAGFALAGDHFDNAIQKPRRAEKFSGIVLHRAVPRRIVKT
jgi:hypothetical protein